MQGPVYEKFDPILGKSNFFGTHVNQAARIEPIVLPGSVFVSETVAAMLSLGYEGFDFEYVGIWNLPRNLEVILFTPFKEVVTNTKIRILEL